MAYSTIRFETKDSIAFVTLSRPQVANALNDTMAAEVADVCRTIQQQDEIRSVVLSGAGEKGFCAGGDLTQFGERLERNPDEIAPSLTGRADAVKAIADLDRPVVAAVHGYALGLGLALALACDFRLAAEDAIFSSPDTGKGYIPMSGITQRLPRLVGRGIAMEMLLTGQRVNAREAWRIGLVNKVVPNDRLLVEAGELAKLLASKAPVATRFAKEAVNKGMNLTLDQGLRLEADMYFLLFSTRDRTEGITAFREKRPPVFTGE
ncbi:MAG: enoyl-CoA hydratase/isomerase family protein [Chloroflexi bacterium]|nr:enoyl-CoA hydratase/isomerase family protein [Chloroflexota bacterium]